nr:hypothetical protein [Tanacetum cinerariifolium]
PPPPPSGPSGASGSPGASGSSQVPPPLPPPPSTNQEDWFCKRQGITELKPQDLKGLAFELVKVFHPNVIHL